MRTYKIWRCLKFIPISVSFLFLSQMFMKHEALTVVGMKYQVSNVLAIRQTIAFGHLQYYKYDKDEIWQRQITDCTE